MSETIYTGDPYEYVARIRDKMYLVHTKPGQIEFQDVYIYAGTAKRFQTAQEALAEASVAMSMMNPEPVTIIPVRRVPEHKGPPADGRPYDPDLDSPNGDAWYMYRVRNHGLWMVEYSSTMVRWDITDDPMDFQTIHEAQEALDIARKMGAPDAYIQVMDNHGDVPGWYKGQTIPGHRLAARQDELRRIIDETDSPVIRAIASGMSHALAYAMGHVWVFLSPLVIAKFIQVDEPVPGATRWRGTELLSVADRFLAESKDKRQKKPLEALVAATISNAITYVMDRDHPLISPEAAAADAGLMVLDKAEMDARLKELGEAIRSDRWKGERKVATIKWHTIQEVLGNVQRWNPISMALDLDMVPWPGDKDELRHISKASPADPQMMEIRAAMSPEASQGLLGANTSSRTVDEVMSELAMLKSKIDWDGHSLMAYRAHIRLGAILWVLFDDEECKEMEPWYDYITSPSPKLGPFDEEAMARACGPSRPTPEDDQVMDAWWGQALKHMERMKAALDMLDRPTPDDGEDIAEQVRADLRRMGYL